MELLKSRIEDQTGLKITYNPPGDGLCFYLAAGYQLGHSVMTARNMVFEYPESNRSDVSVSVGFFA